MICVIYSAFTWGRTTDEIIPYELVEFKIIEKHTDNQGNYFVVYDDDSSSNIDFSVDRHNFINYSVGNNIFALKYVNTNEYISFFFDRNKAVDEMNRHNNNVEDFLTPELYTQKDSYTVIILFGLIVTSMIYFELRNSFH